MSVASELLAKQLQLTEAQQGDNFDKAKRNMEEAGKQEASRRSKIDRVAKQAKHLCSLCIC